MRLREIENRLAEIRADIKARGDQIDAEELERLENEVKDLQEERAALLAATERRRSLLASLATGRNGADPQQDPVPAQGDGRVIRRFPGAGAAEPEDRFDTLEYRTAFMEYVCRGVPIPAEYRTDEVTVTGETGAVIPTTTLNEIIVKLESYGDIYAKVRKLNVQGGVQIPINDIKPTATWIADGAASDDQKLTAENSVSFSYYGLECKIAQSILSNVVSLKAFNDLFVPLATEAMVKAIETAIFTGDGNGKPLGVINDTRITADLVDTNVIEITADEVTTWGGWHKAVKAKIKKAYRNGAFIMAQATFDGYIDGMVDDNGQPVGRTNYGINGEETYRFMGKEVQTVEDILPSYDDAAEGDVFAVFMKLDDYVINSNMQMNVVKWTDHDTNKLKTKCIMVLDGKAADVNGILLIKKAAATA